MAKDEVFKCSVCDRVFVGVGDDHWIECPFCTSLYFTLAVQGKDYELVGKEICNGRE